MKISLHERLDAEALADGEAHLSGRFDAAELDERVAEALTMDTVAGEVHYELEFARAGDLNVAVNGHLQARLVARCQRCLEPFDLETEASPQLLIPLADNAGRPKADREAGEIATPANLAVLIEDELLLAIPFAPRHAAGDCPAGARATSEREASVQRPFDGLAQALEAGRGKRN